MERFRPKSSITVPDPLRPRSERISVEFLSIPRFEPGRFRATKWRTDNKVPANGGENSGTLLCFRDERKERRKSKANGRETGKKREGGKTGGISKRGKILRSNGP